MGGGVVKKHFKGQIFRRKTKKTSFKNRSSGRKPKEPAKKTINKTKFQDSKAFKSFRHLIIGGGGGGGPVKSWANGLAGGPVKSLVKGGGVLKIVCGFFLGFPPTRY